MSNFASEVHIYW